jgi:uncharacterized protein (DUF1684 family)
MTRRSPGRLRHGLTMAAAGWLALAAACTSGPPPPENTGDYEKTIQRFRQDKDEFLRTDRQSPVALAARATFAPLAYYPVDPSLHIPAALAEDRSGPPVIIELPTSKDQKQQMRRVGTLRFTVAGTEYALTAFAEGETPIIDRLFLPFRDATSGGETYGGGRYLNLDRTPTGLYDLDFNRAYHPYCVYNYEYECPVPPRENTLPTPIRAGERLTHPGK